MKKVLFILMIAALAALNACSLIKTTVRPQFSVNETLIFSQADTLKMAGPYYTIKAIKAGDTVKIQAVINPIY